MFLHPVLPLSLSVTPPSAALIFFTSHFSFPSFLPLIHLLYPSYSLTFPLSAPLIMVFCHVYGANGGSWQFPNCFMRYCRPRCAAQKRAASSAVCMMSGDFMEDGGLFYHLQTPVWWIECERQRKRGWPTLMQSNKGMISWSISRAAVMASTHDGWGFQSLTQEIMP